MNLKVITSPEFEKPSDGKIKIFLGGSIELGAARNWQNELIQWLESREYADKLVILNPRRPHWDASWPVDNPDHPQLREQIEWELTHQDQADIIVYLMAHDTISPITLFELGMYAHKNPVIYIEDGFLRRANVIVTAQHFNWPYQENWNDFLAALEQRIYNALNA